MRGAASSWRAARGMAIAALLVARPAAADVLPSIEARVGLGGVMRPGRVVPLIVEASNPGIGLQGQIVVSRSGGKLQSCRSVELPSGSKKQVTVYMDAGEYDSTFEVALRVRGLSLSSVDVEAQPAEADRGIVAMVGAESWGLTRYAKDDEYPLSLALVDPPDVPERWYGWDAADAVVWPERSGEPGPAAARALAHWVEQGGTLVLALGSDGRGLGELASLAGGAISPGAALTRAEILAGLGLDGGDAQVGEERVPVSELRPDASAEVLYEDATGRPLVVESRRGFGRVLAFTFDPAVARLAGAGGSGDLLLELLRIREASSVASTSQYHGDMNLAAAEAFVRGIPPLRPISLTFLLVFMTAYVLVVGPIDYLVLKRLGRMTLTWITYPATIVVFSLLAYAFATSMKGSSMVVTAVEVVDRIAGAGTARRTALTGIFAVERRTYRVTGSPDGLVAWSPSRLAQMSGGGLMLGTTDVRKLDDGLRVDLELPIAIFSQERVLLRESLPEAAPGLAATIERVPVGGRPMPFGGEMDVVVKNEGSSRLLGVAIVAAGGRVVELGDLAAGATRRLSEVDEAESVSEVVGNRLVGVAMDVGAESDGETPWKIVRDGERIKSVDRGMATALGLGLTLPGKAGVLATAPRLASLDLTSRIDAGGLVVIAHEVGNAPAAVGISGAAPDCQYLRIHRLVVDGAGPEEEEGS